MSDTRMSQQTLNLIKEKYDDFGHTMAHEKLTETHEFQVIINFPI